MKTTFAASPVRAVQFAAWVCLAVALAQPAPLAAQDSLYLERLVRLEERIGQLQREAEDQHKQLETLEDEVLPMYKALSWIGIPVTVISLIAFVWGVFFKGKKTIDTRLNTLIDQQFKAKNDTFSQLAEEKQLEHRARKEKKYLVISQYDASATELKGLLDGWGFEPAHIEYWHADAAAPLPPRVAHYFQ